MRDDTIREIEFRGREKRHDGTYGPWIYGGYSHADLWPEIIDCTGIEQCVEPETVGQWTGLLDKGFHRVYEGDVVMDPFMGSGTTGEACIQTKRKFIGVEINPAYFKIAETRIQKAVDNFQNAIDFSKDYATT